jgi:ABC-2 type transport system permease protein
MPIHDQGYRRYGGLKAPLGQGWVVIARAGIRTFLAKRAFLGLLLAAWIRFVIEGVRIYLTTSVPQFSSLPQASLLATTAETFRDMIDSWFVNLIVFLITVYVGAGLIANDRRANALQIYLSKPLTRAEYVFGKLAILIAFLSAVTWLPAILLLVVQISFAGNFTFVTSNLFLFPAITVFAFVKVALLSTTILALSSLSNSARYVGILYTAVIFFTSAIEGVLRAATRSTALTWISFGANLEQIGSAIFRQPLKYEMPAAVSFAVVAAVIVVSALILERRVRGVEVVA